jgi:hypothetical protein
MYVSSCISAGRSLKSDFLFATEIKIVHMGGLRRNTCWRCNFLFYNWGSHGGDYKEYCFCDVIWCNHVEVYQHFRGMYCLHLRTWFEEWAKQAASCMLSYPRRQCSSVSLFL